jgi:hypothetical protein
MRIELRQWILSRRSGVLYATMKRFRMHSAGRAVFAASIPFYRNATAFIDDENVNDIPIRIFHGC